MASNINRGAFYLLKIDGESMIVLGTELEMMLNHYEERKIIVVWDIAKNFFCKEGSKVKEISYQELYRIKRIELV